MVENVNSLNDIKAADYLGIAPQTLRNWRHLKKGPSYVKLGRRVLYRLEDLKAFMESHTITTEAP